MILSHGLQEKQTQFEFFSIIVLLRFNDAMEKSHVIM